MENKMPSFCSAIQAEFEIATTIKSPNVLHKVIQGN